VIRRLWGRSGAFAAKELAELRRDRRVLFASVVLPILIYPATFSFQTHLERRQAARSEETVYRVAVTGDAEPIRQALRRTSGLVLVEESGSAGDALLERVRSGTLDVWLDASRAPAAARLVYQGTQPSSEAALARVRAVIDEVRHEERERRYRAAGGTADLAAFVALAEVDVATRAEAGGAEVGRLVPFLVILTLFLGAAPLAVDSIAGEKERATLETLYLAPVERVEIARAKFLVVTAGTVLTGVLSLASLVLCYRLGLIGASDPGGTVLSLRSLLLSLALVVPLAALVGGLLLGVSAFARSQKEAQYYVLPVMLVAFVPAILSRTQDVRLDAFVALLPVANVAVALRDVLLGDAPAPRIALVAAASVAWALLVVRWTAGVLSREDTILGFAPEPLFSRTPAGRRRAAYVGMAGTVLGFFYVGQKLQMRDMTAGLAQSLWILLPALAAIALRFAWAGGKLGELLSLRRPHPAALLGAAALGLGAVVPMLRGVVRLQSLILPMPEGIMEPVEEGLADLDTGNLLFLLAVSPGVCEELVFRGAFLGLLRRTGAVRSAVLASSAFFALIHLNVFRFAPTFLLGLVLAALVVRTRSVFPAMVFHAVYNGTAVLAGRSGELPASLSGSTGWMGSFALVVLGALLVRLSPRR
jgi:sodium transport system permease protein